MQLPSTMQAVTFDRYGPPEVLEVEEVPVPEPRPHEVLIRVRAATVTAGDCELRAFKVTPSFWLPVRLMVGLFKPRIKILGQELAGEIVAVGADVQGFEIGDAVFSPTDIKMGAYAQFARLSRKLPIVKKPAGITFPEAAGIPVGGLNAIHFIRLAQLRSGDHVLINGAGGSIGTFAIQLAKQAGAEVTAIDSGAKLEVLRELGADHVIDYTQEDFAAGNQQYDRIIDIVGKRHFQRKLRALRSGGRYVVANPGLYMLPQVWWHRLRGNKRLIPGLAPYKVADLAYLGGCVEAGSLRTYIDRTYPLEELQQAHHYVESGAKTGTVAINIPHPGL